MGPIYFAGWVVGAAGFHGLAAGALQRPMSYYTRRINNQCNTDQENGSCKENYHDDDGDHLENGSLSKKKMGEKLSASLLRKQFTPPPVGTSRRIRTYSQDSRGSMIVKMSLAVNEGEFWRYSGSELGSSMVGIYSFSEDTETQDTATDVPSSSSSWCSRIKTSLLAIVSVDVIKRPIFICVLVCGCLLAGGCGLTLVFLPPHAKDLGLSNKQASILLTVISITDMVSIPVWGLIADKHWIDSKTLAALAATVMGTTACFMPFYTTFNTMVFFSLMYGLFGRVWFSMYTIVMVDMFGLANMKRALGILVPSQTLFNSLLLYVVGTMRDSLGSYIPAFQLIATFLIAGAIGLLSLRLIATCSKAGRTQNQTEKEVGP